MYRNIYQVATVIIIKYTKLISKLFKYLINKMEQHFSTIIIYNYIIYVYIE
jgi:hypothetical protein